MQREHKDIILSNLSTLVEETNLRTLVPELLQRNVFNQRMIERILNPSHDTKRQKTDLYVEILRRGPEAFSNLQGALVSANHTQLATILGGMDTSDSSRIQRSYSLTSVGSNRSPCSSDNTSENDGPWLSSCRKTSSGSAGEASKRPDSLPLPSPAQSILQREGSRSPNHLHKSLDLHGGKQSSPSRRVFNLPSYDTSDLDERSKTNYLNYPEWGIKYTVKENLPVYVKYATDWITSAPGKPKLYKMDSNPRGCALLINNQYFVDKEEFPDRNSAENDEIRFTALLKQLHFEVEAHQNKTKAEMVDIVKNFSQKPELENVDCLWVTLMSHGGEGESCEDGQIYGVDGFGYRTSDIISQFYNDSCKAGIDKPKIFFFQACRGNLTDPGVLLPFGEYYEPWDSRIVYDGKRINPGRRSLRVRTHSDILIAYPAPVGIKANRDKFTGAWFIQTVVDIFSEHAKDCHLEDLLKMVDDKIKRMNNLHTSNFQAVTITTIGWSKHLYFNPGLYRDKHTQATFKIERPLQFPESDEGMDVVDASSTSSDKSPNGIQPPYSRLKDDGNEDSEDRDGKYDCFNVSFCKTS